MAPVVVAPLEIPIKNDADNSSFKVTLNSFTEYTNSANMSAAGRSSSNKFMMSGTGQGGQKQRMPNRSIRALRALENKFKGLSVYQDLVDEALCEAVGGEKY